MRMPIPEFGGRKRGPAASGRASVSVRRPLLRIASISSHGQGSLRAVPARRFGFEHTFEEERIQVLMIVKVFDVPDMRDARGHVCMQVWGAMTRDLHFLSAGKCARPERGEV